MHEVSVVAAGSRIRLAGAHPGYLADLDGRDLDQAPIATIDIPQGAVCLDVGANIGATAIPLAARRPDLRIIAFEPVPSNAEFLHRNIRKNGIANIEVIEAAASDAAGEVRIVDNGPWSTLTHDGGVSVKRIRLDDAVTGPVAFIKVDIEGHEPNGLAGARRLLESRPVMLMEFNTWALLRQHYDPLAFAEALYAGCDILKAFHTDQEVPVPSGPIHFVHTNMLTHGSVTDLMMRPRTPLPTLQKMTRFSDNELRAELTAVLNSRSWKITAPMRWIRRRLGRRV